MKRIYFMSIISWLIIFFIFSGCGDGPGSPGSQGTEDTGIDPLIVSVTHSDPSADQGDLWDIDFIQDICDDGKAEIFGNDIANISFLGKQLNPNVPSNNVLYITNYKVTFKREDPSAPIIEQNEYGNQSGIYISPNETTGPFSFLILDTGKKTAIVDEIIDGIYVPKSYPLLYDMEIEMWGQDSYGNDFKIGPIIRMISITNYDRCE